MGMLTQINLMSLILILLLAFSSCHKRNEGEYSYRPIVLDDGWAVSNPTDQGMDSQILDNIFNEAKDLDNIYSLIVVKNGFLIAEKYFNGQMVNDAVSVASVTKSIVSASIGLALEKNLITSTDQKLKEFFSEIDWESTDQRKSEITINQLLQMRSGYPWEEQYRYIDILRSSSDWLPFLKSFPLINDPGAQFGYSNFTAHITGIIVSRSANTSLLSFLRNQLFDGMGISVPFWPKDGLGYYYGSGDIFLTPRSLAKIGQLYLDEGVWDHVRYISSEWISKSLQVYSPTTYGREILSHIQNLGYGYMWWSGTAGNHNIWFAWGHGGQLAVIIKDLNMVVVSTASVPPEVNEDAWHKTKVIMELVGKLIEQIK